MKKYAIIVAGGKGERMGSDTPKQFLPIAGKPVLMHTLEAFFRTDASIHLILVLPEAHLITWEQLCEEYNFSVSHQVVSGGNQRFDSVKNGLHAIEESEALVAIHDGVRPFVSSDIINEAYAMAEEKGTAIAAVSPKDSIRQYTSDQLTVAVKREDFVFVQTPQTFRLSLLRDAYSLSYLPVFTDDASVAEAKGYPVYLVMGSYLNIKITTPEDLLFAESILAQI